jgi:hypothetical protein
VIEPRIIHVVDISDPVVFFVTNQLHRVALRVEARADEHGTLSIHTTEEVIAGAKHEHQ